MEDGGQVRTSPSLIRRVIGIPSLSFLVGIVTGTLGASGGIMFIAVMMILEPGLPIKRMIGTATLGMLLSAISGASAYIYTGVIDIYASIVIGIIALISGYFFAKLANKADPRYIYAFLGSIFVVTAMTEAIKYYINVQIILVLQLFLRGLHKILIIIIFKNYLNKT
ncbi:sulfite exporter TauE/SafE family protein [Sulfuracidifex metallicus]|uniref:sulfite exporter TauE/SafE family protein n=1 Tax=Sulfuracidifex metallicus TaxID=47303 RepID=UPI000A5DCFCB|nr:sulfite exporter TauE/SafE family protein [Sulfuracidifex metallicus]